MAETTILGSMVRLARPVFTTAEVQAIRGGSLSSIVQSLSALARQGVVARIRRGLWALKMGTAAENSFPYALLPYIVPAGRGYVSFTSALHLHGIIGQIPQAVTVASPTHTRTVHTSMGTFFIHRIAPSFFKGYDWYRGTGSFLIAEPEKALVDCLYISTRRNKRFAYFPEMDFPRSFSPARARAWARQIPYSHIRVNVLKKLSEICP